MTLENYEWWNERMWRAFSIYSGRSGWRPQRKEVWNILDVWLRANTVLGEIEDEKKENGRTD